MCIQLVIYKLSPVVTSFFLLDCRFWKDYPEFILVLHCKYTSIVHHFWFNYFFIFAGNDVIAILSLGARPVIADYGFWKGDPDFIFMLNWHFSSILNGLDVIRLFLFGWDFPLGVGKIWMVLGQNDPQNVKWEKNTCWEGTYLRHTASFEPLCVKLSLAVWPVRVRKKKRQEGRKKS